MIWRALLFLALLGGGFAALHFALGSDAFTAPRVQTGVGEKPPEGRPASGGGIAVAPPKPGEKPVTFSVEGKLELQRTREIPLTDGSRLLLPTYKLRAADSRPLPEGDNLMELRDVVVELYRLNRKVPAGAEPRADLAGELRAARVRVEIERDEHGRPSLQEDREMEFSDAVFSTLPAAGIVAMKMTLARAKLRTTSTQALLRTEPMEPFTLELGGEQPATMLGKGLAATVPIGDTPGPIDLRVLHEPQLTMDDGRTVIRAAGEMHFAEQPGQSAELTLERDVFLQSALLQGRPPLLARGDRLRAGLRRNQRSEQRDGKPGALWHWLELTGSAVHVDAGEAQIDCVRVDVLPSLDGAGLLTATGSPTKVTLSRPGEPPSVLSSERRIHIVPLTQNLQGYLGPYGFPVRQIARSFAQAIVFSGNSQIEMQQPQGLLRLSATQGLLALRGDDELGSLSLRGRGVVTATIPGGGKLNGDDGFLLHDAPSAQGRRTTLTLGVDGQPAPSFSLQRPTEHLAVSGHGHCELVQTTSGTRQEAKLDIASPTGDAVVQMPQGTLRDVRTLTALLRGGALVDLDARGTPCRIEGEVDGERITGDAEHIVSGDGASFTLTGTPAHLQRPGTGALSGAKVELLRRDGGFGKVAYALRGHGDARLNAGIARKDGSKMAVDLHGKLVELLPWRVPPAAIDQQVRWLPAAAALVFAAQLRQPHVHSHTDVTMQLDEPTPAAKAPASKEQKPAGQNRARGQDLWLALTENAGRGALRGTPAEVEVVNQGQSAVGGASLISFEQSGEAVQLTLHAQAGEESTMRLGASRANTATAALRELSVFCLGDIKVEARKVRFLGKVRVIGQEAANSAPAMTITADGMEMERDADGTVTDIVAIGNVVITTPRLRGEADRLAVDLRRTLAVLSRSRGEASIVMDDGAEFRLAQLEVNYTTYAVRGWYGQIEPRRDVVEPTDGAAPARDVGQGRQQQLPRTRE